MSRSIHVTSKNFKGLTKKEIDEQAKESGSDLDLYAKKMGIKRAAAKNRKLK